MRKLIVLGCLLMVFGCKQEESTLLQHQDIQLVKPRVIVSNLIIDSSVIVKAELKMKDVKIYFTSDESEPNESSELYEQPLQIELPGIYKFKAFHPEWKVSETETVEFIKKGKHVDAIIWDTKPNEKYKGQGVNTLINNTKAMVSFMNPEWVGFDTIAKATVRFKNVTDVRSLDIGYLNNPSAWIFPPEQVRVFVSFDGTSFIEKEALTISSLKQMTDQKSETIHVLINEKIKAVKIEIKNLEAIPSWHDGAGNKAWVFMDEWIFN